MKLKVRDLEYLDDELHVLLVLLKQVEENISLLEEIPDSEA